MTTSWSFATSGKVLFGPGTLGEVAPAVSRLGARRVLLVSGQNAAAAAARVAGDLRTVGCEAVAFGGIVPEPPVDAVEWLLGLAAQLPWDAVVAIGGGSVLDTAKLIAALAGAPGPLSRYFGVGQVPAPGRPLIAVPTTAGTGSEVTAISIVTDTERGVKVGIVSPYLYPAVAVVDPELTLGKPFELTVAAGVDALVHAVEAYLSRGASPLTDALALEAVRRIAGHLRAAAADGANLAARTGMALGSTLAGMAFGAAGVAAVHALAYPLGGRHGVPHGLANSVLFPRVMAFTLPGRPDRARPLLAALGTGPEPATDAACCEALVAALHALNQDLQVARIWRQHSPRLTYREVRAMAAEAVGITRLMRNNPRPMDAAAAAEIYAGALVDLGTPAAAVPA